MIVYRGREMPCHTWRSGQGDCLNYSEFRVEAPHAFLHLCARCADRFRGDSTWTCVPLAPPGETDTLPAVPAANADQLLLGSPWMVSINGRTRAEVLAERGRQEGARAPAS